MHSGGRVSSALEAARRSYDTRWPRQCQVRTAIVSAPTSPAADAAARRCTRLRVGVERAGRHGVWIADTAGWGTRARSTLGGPALRANRSVAAGAHAGAAMLGQPCAALSSQPRKVTAQVQASSSKTGNPRNEEGEDFDKAAPERRNFPLFCTARNAFSMLQARRTTSERKAAKPVKYQAPCAQQRSAPWLDPPQHRQARDRASLHKEHQKPQGAWQLEHPQQAKARPVACVPPCQQALRLTRAAAVRE